jgi:hypothetical protein
MRGYLVWILETAPTDCAFSLAEPSNSCFEGFTLKLLIPQTDAETLALPDCIGRVKQGMHSKFCYAVGTMVVNGGTGGAQT